MYNNDTYITLHLPYQGTYHWPHFLQFQNHRLITGLEFIDGDTYGRNICEQGVDGWFTITPAKNGFDLQLSDNLQPQLAQITANIRRMFDLDTDTRPIEARLQQLYPRLPIVSGLHIPGIYSPFEAGVRAICAQRISVVAASKLVNKLVQAFATISEQGRLCFPQPESLNPYTLSSISMMRDKRATLLDFARCWLENQHRDLSTDLPYTLQQQLLDIKGIDPWTVNDIRLRACNAQDIWMGEDLSIRQSLQKIGAIDESQAMPYRSYLTLQLWNMYNLS